MSILIKGMDMPYSCKTCDLCQYGFWGFCFANYEKIADEGRREDCPLIEVSTPHGDLIDREELLNDAGGVYTARPEEAQKIQHEINKVLFSIQDAPTVIEAEGE